MRGNTTGRLPFGGDEQTVDARLAARDGAARERAVDPRFNVALEASAGTGKTHVLVDRYINLLRAGVDPTHILAITFTRKAAAEMRERILVTLRAVAARGELPSPRWRELRDRTADIAISTIDAFCLSLLREFPLEADVDPGFSMADDTELPRLMDEALDRTLRICRGVARQDEAVALVFAQLGERRARAGLAALLQRRVVAPRVLAAYLASGPVDLDAATIGRRAAIGLVEVFESMRGGLDRFMETGPLEPAFLLLARSVQRLRESLEAGSKRTRPTRESERTRPTHVGRVLLDPPCGSAGSADAGRVPPDAPSIEPAAVQRAFVRAREYFLTQDGRPRTRSQHPRRSFASATDWRTHTDLIIAHAEKVARVSAAYRRDLNVLVSRGIWRMYRVADAEYRRTLDAHAVLDFSDLLLRTLDLLRRMEEFARSRYRLESRYHHVLVDEFQDTSRAQWELVSLLIQSWGEGAGLADGPLRPSIFIVGDRKQSIYGFRDADVSVLREAARHIATLRPDGDVRQSISRSFRAVPALLAFVNDVCQDIDKTTGDEAFEYDEGDRFPIDEAATQGPAARDERSDALGLVVADTSEACAEITARQIGRLLSAGVTVRDRDTRAARAVRPGDIAILFRSRESHRDFETALDRRGIACYVYKGLGFFDADEIKDVLALVWYLADPESDLRAAALMRSRFFAISDEGLRRLAPGLAEALSGSGSSAAIDSLSEADNRGLADAQAATAKWRRLVDRIPPAELVDLILTESAYAFELRGPRFPQARENLKKIRSLLRRLQNRGYATLARIAAHLDRLAVGDEANASIDALDAVNLMTVHASKGLEFPVVFIVNLARGTGSRRDPVRLSPEAHRDAVSVAVGDFQSEADEDRGAREREETKRLLYVALTRARDRLYLATTLKDRRVAPARGSLAEVLPQSLLQLFSECSHNTSADDAGRWRASSGAVHRLQVCALDESGASAQPCGQACAPRTLLPGSPRAADGPRAQGALGQVPPEPSAKAARSAPLESDFEPLVDSAAIPRPVVGMVETGGAVREGSATTTGDSDRIVGRLVHRMLQRFGFDAGEGPVVREAALRMLRTDEMAGLAAGCTAAELADSALLAYRAICARPDVREIYLAGERLHEVPFTMHVDGAVVRGTIDCLVRTAANRVTLLEFKTGRPHAEHHRQVDLYRRAAERLFPGSVIDARLVYASAAGPEPGTEAPVARGDCVPPSPQARNSRPT